MKQHKEGKHEGIRYPCDQCDYASTTTTHLERHKEYKHEGIRYPCDQCDFTFITSSRLKMHKDSKHVGIKYPCDQCEYSGSKVALYHHKRSKHVGIRYPCDQCEYTVTQNGSLKSHKKAKQSEATAVIIQNNTPILKRKVYVRIEK